MIPTRRSVWLLVGWLALGVAASAQPSFTALWAGFGLAFAAAVVLEGILLRRVPTPLAHRQLPASLAVGRWQVATLRLTNPGSRAVQLRAFDHHPSEFDAEALPLSLSLPAVGWAEGSFRFRPNQRGVFAFKQAEIQLLGTLGLLEEQRQIDCLDEVRVYPDFREMARYGLLANEDRTARMGIHLQRRRGEGLEFHQLREYRPGDALRRIDWKATSRRHQLISREYREERDQQVVILLDCGRRMRAQDGPLAHFDQALNAALLLSYVALRQGDAVGLLAFSGAQRWLPPVKGRGAINRLLNGVFDLQPTDAPSDFAAAAIALAARQRRRALVVLITNLRDDDSDGLNMAMKPLKRRHLILAASLREAALRQATLTPLQTFPDALRAAAAQEYLENRDRTHSAIRRKGLMTLDVEPQQLPAELVNRYLEIKRAGQL
ncbi:MAG: DUF58 domain-containing protein [Myxococcota bacterium]